MQPLGSQALTEAYNAHISSDHDFSVQARVLSMEEKFLGKAVLLGGQINIQRDSLVRRTATFSLFDPDHSLALDSTSPFAAALFADRMLQIRHTVTVPQFGDVTVVPFVGPISILSRDGDTIQVECQDKSSLAVRGTRPYRVKGGMNAVAAIRAILADRCGERRFRFPKGTKARLDKSYNVGWADEAAPWVVCDRIARQVLGMQLLYSCDGYATLRRQPKEPVFVFSSKRNLTSLLTAGYDFSEAVNYARVEVGKVSVKTAELPSNEMMSKSALSRNGVPRFLPVTESLSTPSKPKKKAKAKEKQKYRRQVRNITEQARERAHTIIEANRTLTGDFSWSAIPVMHLDVDDPVAVRASSGGASLRFSEASIPVLIEGDMTCGRQVNLMSKRRSKRGRGR